MDKNIEENFVKTFVEKLAQKRFLFELSSGNAQKRHKVISRFAHGTERYINKQYIYLASEKLKIDDVKQEIIKLTQKIKQCYVISDAYDGETMSFEQALEKSFEYPDQSIVLINDNICFIKAEIERGSPMKYILYKKNWDYTNISDTF